MGRKPCGSTRHDMIVTTSVCKCTVHVILPSRQMMISYTPFLTAPAGVQYFTSFAVMTRCSDAFVNHVDPLEKYRRVKRTLTKMMLLQDMKWRQSKRQSDVTKAFWRHMKHDVKYQNIPPPPTHTPHPHPSPHLEDRNYGKICFPGDKIVKKFYRRENICAFLLLHDRI